MTFIPLWAQQQQQNVIGELFQLLIILLVFVVPAVIKYFTGQAALKKQQQLAEQTLEEHLREAFSTAAAEEAPKEFVVRQRPKPPKKRKRTELVLESDTDQPTAHRPSLSRELAPQGEGIRFEARPGTFDASQTLIPRVEPTVQPMLDSMTGIYDVPSDGKQSTHTLLAVDILRMFTTPSGAQQAVVLGEILKRPEF